jgi:hypothetical protein
VIPAAPTVTVGNPLQLQVVANNSSGVNQGTTPSGTWSSSDTEVVKVSSNGLLLGIGQGFAIVTFSCSTCQPVDVPVTVIPNVTSLTISPTTATMNSGTSFQFAAAGVVDGKQQDVTNLAFWTIDKSLGGAATIGAGLLTVDSGAVTMQTVVTVTASYGGLRVSAPVFVNP